MMSEGWPKGLALFGSGFHLFRKGFPMTPNVKPSQRVAVLGKLDPVSQSAATVNTGWISAANFYKFLAILSVGAMGASGTIDAKLQQASDSSGTGAKDISGTTITQLTKAGSDDNKIVEINLDQSQLDLANNFTHFRLSVTVGTAASLIAAQVLGFDPRYAPASDYDIAAVDEIVN